MQGGLPKFKLINQNLNQDIKNFMNGNQFEIMFMNNSFSVISQKHGIQYFDLKNKKIENIPSSEKCVVQNFNFSMRKFYFATKIEVLNDGPDELYRPQFSMV